MFKNICNLILILGAILVLASCSQNGILIINASTPSRIERQGIEVCSSTPCKINAYGYKNGFGECISGSNTYLEAFPINKKRGYKQSKVVYAECNSYNNIYFDMQSAGAINTIQKSSRK
jgi:hypothetical protein